MTSIKIDRGGTISKMYYQEAKMIIDINTVGQSYIIDVESGFKAQFNVINGTAYCWPYKITKRDIERAKKDSIDISRIEYPFAGHTCKDVKQIYDRIEECLKSFQFSSKRVERVLFNFV